jgi:hypothetical protein
MGRRHRTPLPLSEGSMKLITQQRHDSDGVAKPAALTA